MSAQGQSNLPSREHIERLLKVANLVKQLLPVAESISGTLDWLDKQGLSPDPEVIQEFNRISGALRKLMGGAKSDPATGDDSAPDSEEEKEEDILDEIVDPEILKRIRGKFAYIQPSTKIGQLYQDNHTITQLAIILAGPPEKLRMRRLKVQEEWWRKGVAEAFFCSLAESLLSKDPDADPEKIIEVCKEKLRKVYSMGLLAQENVFELKPGETVSGRLYYDITFDFSERKTLSCLVTPSSRSYFFPAEPSQAPYHHQNISLTREGKNYIVIPPEKTETIGAKPPKAAKVTEVRKTDKANDKPDSKK